MLKLVTSRENPGWRQLVDLASSARERKRQSRTVLEGIHLCEAYQRLIGGLETLIVSESALENREVQQLLMAEAGPAYRSLQVPDALFREFSQLEHGIGVAGVVPTPAAPLPAHIDEDCVYLDRLQDPGNVGTILRTCAAAGVRRVAVAPGTTGCWSPKVLRAGMGAHFALVIHEGVPWPRLREAARINAVATTPDAPATLYHTDLRAPRLWLFGNEGNGLADEILQGDVERVAIPQNALVESLNVSSAVAICLYEQLRQRQSAAS